ncbi:hypothetical protein PR202_gb27200 [Eleusine coracana subsp. coracana]|uniref:S-type anion channel SLAH3 n=1 Tax=Eleusine coracana subsp. coracana TaxID=191504 RepID=A0AAV5FTU6_ELECO|nr:hypothetical protein PR202_gb27200 [Eleusine coracana subsp. coracana]
MKRCSGCFARSMETEESHRPARVQPDADGVHAEEPVFRDDEEMDMVAAACSPLFQAPGAVVPTAAARPVSISLPASPSRAFDMARTTGKAMELHGITGASRAMLPPLPPPATSQPDRVVFRSQPIPAMGRKSEEVPARMGESRMMGKAAAARRDKSFDSFKTWSGKLEKQIATHLLGTRPHQQDEPSEQEEEEDPGTGNASATHHTMPRVQRFFAALEGPELDTLRVLRTTCSSFQLQLVDHVVVAPVYLVVVSDQSSSTCYHHGNNNHNKQSSEELILPSDKTWPFLLRFPVSAFGMVLGMSSQAILWKRVAISASTGFLHITVKINLVLWCVSVALMCAVSALYACKLVFFFEAVRREYYHPIRVNFFFAPWIACLFLAIGVPPSVATDLPDWLWYMLMAPILCLQLKIYGQWISGGQRRLSRVANPSNHLSIVGNFVGALLGGIMGLKEGPLFFFAVGLAHYVVLFVTLYQRLPTSETLPRDLHPVFFLFVATPSVACLAWARITGEFDYGSKIAYFIAMFLYASLAVRINLFRGFHFSLAWWAYTFPMTSAAIASIRYSSEVKNVFTQALCIGLSVASTLTVTALFFTTLLHAVVLRDLFPNDISIAITERRFKPTVPTATEMMMMPAAKRRSRKALAHAASDAKDLEAAVATSYT